MVTDIAIYLEGGGPTKDTRTPFRRGMSEFLQPLVQLVRQQGVRWRIIPCGSRNEAFADFCDALTNESGVFNVLLVDSETLPTTTNSPWSHLSQRKGDEWTKPTSATDEHCHLMTACMESWLVVDRDALKKHFTKGFDESKLPLPQYVETTEKEKIADALSKATKGTTTGSYGKIRDGAKLLALADSSLVRKHCKWCDRFFKTLAATMGTTV